MTFPEIIGFIISILALLFLFLRPVWDARERRKHPQEYQKKQQEREKRLKQFMKTLDSEVEEDEEEEPVALPRKGKQQESIQANQRPSPQLPKAPYIRPVQPVTQQHLDAQRKLIPKIMVYGARKELESRAARLIQQQRTLKDAVLLSEIIGLPKGMSTRDRH